MSKVRLLCLFVAQWKQIAEGSAALSAKEKGIVPISFDFDMDEAIELIDEGLLYDDFSPTDKGLELAEKLCKKGVDR